MGLEKKDNTYKFVEFFEDFSLDEATNALFEIFKSEI